MNIYQVAYLHVMLFTVGLSDFEIANFSILYFLTVFDTLVDRDVVYKTDAVESLLSFVLLLSVSKQ